MGPEAAAKKNAGQSAAGSTIPPRQGTDFQGTQAQGIER
jgi:hypothetical protein